MADESVVQILKKTSYDEQYLVRVPTRLNNYPPLAESSVRAKAVLIALTSNNISYAAMGSVLNWWDAFPVPNSAPEPLNNPDAYGILPTWGYGEVLQSTTSIETGTLMWGYWPASSLPVDLHLEAGVAPGHWIETSPRRSRLMTMYNRYVAQPGLGKFHEIPSAKIEQLAWSAIVKPLWQSSDLMNRFVFTDGTQEPMHPMQPAGSESRWSAEQADLSSAVVVLLAASSKTAISLAHELKASRAPKSGPLSLLAVTSATSLKVLERAPFPTKLVGYADLTADGTLSWIKGFSPDRVVTFDYGGRKGSAEMLSSALVAHCPDVALTQVAVGGEAKVRPVDPTAMASVSLPRGMVRANASGQRDVAVSRLGEERFFSSAEALWNKALASGDLTAGQLYVGEGLEGEAGFEGAWRRLCKGDFSVARNTAFKI